ncbi:hypothetical protein O6H91_21G022900 [Diphasiastrum complanatum]|uniref:Uncharacterized protein n=1 Tax=Diphasiastrum complanatum TaxID=34168 RepID=A0ACC2AIQ3_DIPCM|nr:hypothetical protein O6H91_21G022900 [Diphasiastrum complanatum]
MEICGLSVGGNLDTAITFCSKQLCSPPTNARSERFASKLIDARPAYAPCSLVGALGNSEQRPISRNWRKLELLPPSKTCLQGSSSLRKAAKKPKRRTRSVQTKAAVLESSSTSTLDKYADEQDFIKAGGEELPFVQMQAYKTLDQPKIADKVPAFSHSRHACELLHCVHGLL